MSDLLKEHDPHHPYVKRLIGCGHGVLFSDYCRDCEIVWVMDSYRSAVRKVQSCRENLRRLGIEPPEANNHE